MNTKPIVFCFFLFPCQIFAQYNSQQSIDAVTYTNNIVTNILAVDMNGDGLKDVVVHRYQNELLWYRNLGGLVFGAAEVIFDSIPYPFSLDAADVNNDGKGDLLVSNNNSTASSIELFLSGGLPHTTIDSSLFGAYNSFFVDFDNDGDKDIVSCSDLLITLYLNNGAGVFGSRVVLLSGSEYYNISMGHFNNDNYPDLALASSNGSQIYLNNTMDGVGPAITLSTLLSGFVAQSNMDNIGTDEAFFVSPSGGFFDMYENDGANNFSIRQTTEFNQPNVQHPPFKLGDVNNDNYMDAAFAVLGSGLFTRLNDGTGQFLSSKNLLDNTHTYTQIALADLDNDHAPELIYFRIDPVTNEKDLGFFVNENNPVSSDNQCLHYPAVSLYPNPTCAYVSMSGNMDKDEGFLFSLDGKMLYTSRQFPLDLSHLPNGTYLLSIIRNGQVILIKKIIKTD